MTDLRAEIRRQVRMFRDQPDIAADQVVLTLEAAGIVIHDIDMTPKEWEQARRRLEPRDENQGTLL